MELNHEVFPHSQATCACPRRLADAAIDLMRRRMGLALAMAAAAVVGMAVDRATSAISVARSL